MEIDDLQSDKDDEYEVEELLVYIDIDPTLLSDKEIEESTSAKIFGIDTKKPLLKINNQYFEGEILFGMFLRVIFILFTTFSGEYDISIGTHTFFEKDTSRPVDELYCKTDCYYKYSAQTSKVLKMSRVLLQNNETGSILASSTDTSDIKGQLEVKNTYEEALNLFLPPGRSPPRKIPVELNGANLINPKT